MTKCLTCIYFTATKCHILKLSNAFVLTSGVLSFSGVTDYGVTVKAEDQGSPSLAGFCTFRVKIGDKNDNPPVFDFPDYETSIEEASPLGKRVLQVKPHNS